MTPDPELLGDEPVRLGRVPERDVLDAEPVPLWRPPRWWVAAVLLVAVVATAGWYADRQERAREARALEGCRLQLQDAVSFSDVRLTAMADYLDPALGVTKGARRGELADLMSQPARQVVRGVERADRTCRAVSIRPWHVALVSRHEATTAYSSALAVSLRTIAVQGRAYYRDSSRLQQLREAAEIPVLGGPF